MSRLASTLLVLALLGATAAAFAVTQGLKLERSPITRPKIDKVFSPVCRCPTRVARIAFSLRKSGSARVSIVDESGEVVRELRRLRGKGRQRLTWDGRDDAGRLVPDGSYRPRVRLPNQRRTIVLPNEIVVDLTPPRISLLGVGRGVISPDGDGRADGVAVRYRVNEPARALLLVNGKRRVRGLRKRLTGHVEWYGKRGGRPVRRGSYRIQLVAQDLAGNLSQPTPAVAVRIRYVEVVPDVVRTRAGARFTVRVSTDARRYRWLFAGRRGSSSRGVVALRAPAAGVYALFVEANGRADRAVVVVRPAR